MFLIEKKSVFSSRDGAGSKQDVDKLMLNGFD